LQPEPEKPPPMVVPYRFPAASKIRPARGIEPSGQPLAEQNLCSTVSVHVPLVPGLNRKAVPCKPSKAIVPGVNRKTGQHSDSP
jgi:hypothetical protein